MAGARGTDCSRCRSHGSWNPPPLKHRSPGEIEQPYLAHSRCSSCYSDLDITPLLKLLKSNTFTRVPAHLSRLIACPLSLTHSAVATLASLLFLKHTRHSPASGPLHLFVSLLGCSSPNLEAPSLTSFRSLLEHPLLRRLP